MIDYKKELIKEALSHSIYDMEAMASSTKAKDLADEYARKAEVFKKMRREIDEFYLVPKNFLTPFLQIVFWAVVFAVVLVGLAYVY